MAATAFQSAKSAPVPASHANPLPVYTKGAGGAIDPSTSTIANTTDTTIAFAGTYDRIRVQNNSGSPLYYAWDTAASTGRFILYPQQTLMEDVSSALHLYQASGGSISINTAGGIAIQAFSTPTT